MGMRLPHRNPTANGTAASQPDSRETPVHLLFIAVYPDEALFTRFLYLVLNGYRKLFFFKFS